MVEQLHVEGPEGQLQLALKAFDVKLFDHVILADNAYYSFQDERVCKSE